MYSNQYFISNKPIPTIKKGTHFEWQGMNVWTDDKLEVNMSSMGIDVLLLGYIIHPAFPQLSNASICKRLASFTTTSSSFFNEFNQLIGRFVLLIKTKKGIIILNDPGAQKQVYYAKTEGERYITSSPKLVYELTSCKFVIPKEKQIILESKIHKRRENWFPGDEYLDEKLKRLLPNFYLDIKTNQTNRIPFNLVHKTKEELMVDIKEAIAGAMRGISFRFKNVYLGVTAGADSRLILSCNKEVNVKYFVYNRDNENITDLKVAKQITEAIGKNLQVINPPKIKDDFIVKIKSNILLPRTTSKHRNVAWLSKHLQNKNAVVVMGYCGELYRNSVTSLNPYYKKFNTHKDFIAYLNYPKTSYLKKFVDSWFNGLNKLGYRELNKIDLFYWENHMVPYCSLYSYEQDLAGVEVFCPLFNRELILNLLHNTTSKERGFPNGITYKLINHEYPDLRNIPYNPKPIIKKIKNIVFKVLPLKLVNKIMRYL